MSRSRRAHWWTVRRAVPPRAVESDVFINFRTGERRAYQRPPGGRTPQRDLNDPNLGVMEPEVRSGLLWFVDGQDRVLWSVFSRMQLYRGGNELTGTIRCSMGCDSPRLSGGVLSWTDGKRAHLYRLSSGKQLSFSFPAVAGGSVATTRLGDHTKYAGIFEALASETAQGEPTFKVYTTPLPPK